MHEPPAALAHAAPDVPPLRRRAGASRAREAAGASASRARQRSPRRSRVDRPGAQFAPRATVRRQRRRARPHACRRARRSYAAIVMHRRRARRRLGCTLGRSLGASRHRCASYRDAIEAATPDFDALRARRTAPTDGDGTFRSSSSTAADSSCRHDPRRIVRGRRASRPMGDRVAYGAFGQRPHDERHLGHRSRGRRRRKRLTDDDVDSNDPQWSPEGTTIAYSVERARRQGRRCVIDDGGEPRVLAVRDGTQFPSDWLRDGSALLVTDDAGGNGTTSSCSPRTDRPRVPTRRRRRTRPRRASHPTGAGSRTHRTRRDRPGGRHRLPYPRPGDA